MEISILSLYIYIINGIISTCCISKLIDIDDRDV